MFSPRHPRSSQRGNAVFEGILSAAVVCIGFFSYELVAPREFEARAKVAIAAPTRALTSEPREVARRIRDAVFDESLLDRVALAGDIVRGSAEAARVAVSIRIDSSDARSVSISSADDDRERAVRICNEIAELVVERAPAALASAAEDERRALLSNRLAELAALATAHPELIAPTPTRSASVEQLEQWRQLTQAIAALLTNPDARASVGEIKARLVEAPAVWRIRADGLPSIWFGIVSAVLIGLVVTFARPKAARTRPEEDATEPARPSPLAPSLARSPASPREAAPPAVPNEQRLVTTMLPPAARADQKFEATDLVPMRSPSSVIPALLTTQVLGSPVPPPAGQRAPASSVPPASRALTQASSAGRYSFVSTPPPTGGAAVKPHDVSPDWTHDPRLDAELCRPLCREVFAFGVEHCFTIGMSAVSDLEEEKSELAASLALALAAPGHARVLLIDADFDRPAQHRLMRAEMPPGTGFSRQLQGHMMGLPPEHWNVLRCTKSLHLLIDGQELAPGLILSRAFEACVRCLRAYYDFIVIDGPTGSREAECGALDGVADGLIIACTEERRAEIPQTSRLFTTKRFSKAVRVASPER